MIAHPAQLLLSFAFGVSAAAVLALALYLLVRELRVRRVPVDLGREPDVIRGHPVTAGDHPERTVEYQGIAEARGPNPFVILLALAMLVWVFAGKSVLAVLYTGGGAFVERPVTDTGRVRGASGAELAVARYGPTGPSEAPVLLFTHGWGADRRDWAYAIAALPTDLQVVVWDLPGLGASSNAGDYAMQTLAADLDSVVESVGQPVILVGHSVGGMLNLEYVRRYPEKMGREVVGLVQANTTFTNPVLTKKDSERSRSLQKPVLEPLLHVVSALSPIARAAGWLAYRSGLAHLQLASQSFAGAETWDQLDQMARYAYRSSPDVVARGVLGMLHWDGTEVLSRVSVPTLVISGDEDVTTLPSASDRMAREIPRARRMSVIEAAHLGPVERYRTYAAAIAAFAGQAASGVATVAAAR